MENNRISFFVFENIFGCYPLLAILKTNVIHSIDLAQLTTEARNLSTTNNRDTAHPQLATEARNLFTSSNRGMELVHN